MNPEIKIVKDGHTLLKMRLETFVLFHFDQSCTPLLPITVEINGYDGPFEITPEIEDER